jgi:hypothetical protein
MLDSKLTKIKDLIIQREKIDAELEALLGGIEKKRGRPKKADPASGSESQGGGD